MPEREHNTVTPSYERGLELARGGHFFEAHEEFETAWRGCSVRERDFFQGLVHVVVSAYQRGRGRPVAAESQRQKALRRLAAFEPSHRGLDVAHLRAQLERAEADPRKDLIERDLEPPVAPEEEQQPQRDERHA